jgi:hypothetical protein
MHSSQVPLVLNVETKKISPQFHVIFDNNFQTVHSLPSNKPIHEQWKDILKLGRECFADTDYDDNGEPILPKLLDIINTFCDEREQRAQQVPLPPLPKGDSIYDNVDNQAHPPQDDHRDPPLPDDPAIPIPSSFTFPGGDNPVTGGVNAFPGGDTAVVDNGRPRCNVGTYKDGPAKIRRLPIDGKSYELAYPTDAPFSSLYPVPVISNTAGRPSNYHPKERLNKQFLTECYFFKTHGFKNRIVSPPSLITCLLTIGAMGWTVFSSMISLTRVF